MENNLNLAGSHSNERESRVEPKVVQAEVVVGGLAAVWLIDFMGQSSRPAGGCRAFSRAAHTETWH